jgi:hypothetical protein
MESIADNPIVDTTENPPSVEERRALIERVAASEQFSRSARLRNFLLYVGRQSLKDGCPEIHEQEIGAKVFGRPDSYDRTSDNIVRVNATELRKRIESYFAMAGAQEPLIFEIPRGGYKPVFHRRASALNQSKHEAVASEKAAAAVEQPPASQPAVVPAPSHRRTRLLWPFVSLSLAVACVILLVQNHAMRSSLHPWQNQPAVAAFWTGFFDASKDTEIVLSDDSASVIEDITNRPILLGDYLSRSFMRDIQSSSMSDDRKADLFEVFNHNLVTFGAVRATQMVLAQIPANSPRYLTYSRNFAADEVKRNNVIFLGGQKAVPWDYLFRDQVNFVMDYDYARRLTIVRNRNPKPGEQAIYPVNLSSDNLIGYATISYLPNPGRTAHDIILAGSDSDATAAAAAFLTSEDQMDHLQNTFHAKKFPYFEALIRTSRVGGTFFNAELVAYRTHQ